ncbi:hypothetical protein [Sporosarcina limicola]|uniref:Uncharacterized protein n=1 Tax=Sporosarcina limicola TaxID=34101 RepID=A0A927MIJ4_9BACL|nr:hypothetical protein [Sporosarcina limicola]MBE1553632.1 hypothetical protein [Sporosarcina limicola]
MWRKTALFMGLLLGMIVFIPTMTAFAAPELKVSITTGIDGKAKAGKGAPVTITIENSGTDFSGDLILDIPYSYMAGSGEAIALAIGAGETKTISMIIPKMNDFGGMQGGPQSIKTIYFYEGGWEKGKEISHKGKQQLTSTLFYDDTKFIVMFTDNVDRVSALKNVRIPNASGQQLINGSKMSEANYPEEASGWGVADFIVIDEYPLADLSEKKQEALLGWVRSGGVIVIGGSDNVEAEAGLFVDYLPLQLKGSTQLNSDFLNNWSGTKGFKGQIPSYETVLKPGALSLLEDKKNPLIAYKQVGNGFVMQTSFSIGDEPLSKMEGMGALWSTIFDEGQRKQQISIVASQNYGDPLEAIVHMVGNSNELFPSFKVSAPLIFGIIIVYMIIIIPILYFILKRKDKREYAWWIIPSIAILTSLAIFAYGAKDRIGRAQIQHAAVLNIQQDGGMEGYFAESILTNKSGDYAFTAPAETLLIPSSSGRYFDYTSALSHKNAIIEKDATGSTLHLRDVGFWDVASVYGKTRVENIGDFESKLRVEDKKLTGSVMNGFPFALKDVAIWSGATLIPLGNIGPGESVQVNETLKTSTLLPRRSLLNPYMNPTPVDQNDLEKMKVDSLQLFSGEVMNSAMKPVVMGYTDTKIAHVQLDKVNHSTSSLTMLVKPIEVDLIFVDKFTVDSQMMPMKIASEVGSFEPHLTGPLMDQYYFQEAVYNQTWQLPEKLMKNKIHWSSLEVGKTQKKLYDVSILNVKTGLFEPSDSGKLEKTANVDQYISPEGQIVIQMFIHDAKNGVEAKVPELKLNGEVAK